MTENNRYKDKEIKKKTTNQINQLRKYMIMNRKYHK